MQGKLNEKPPQDSQSHGESPSTSEPSLPLANRRTRRQIQRPLALKSPMLTESCLPGQAKRKARIVSEQRTSTTPASEVNTLCFLL